MTLDNNKVMIKEHLVLKVQTTSSRVRHSSCCTSLHNFGVVSNKYRGVKDNPDHDALLFQVD